MANDNHTPGKLEAIRRHSHDTRLVVGKATIASMGNWLADEEAEQEANALRLVACWNACEEAGISTADLESGALKELLSELNSCAITAHYHNKNFCAGEFATCTNPGCEKARGIRDKFGKGVA
jgi:hypothetical protein